MRVVQFTDTLGDVNGVSRFIQNVAHQANETGRELHVVTSTGFPVPEWDNIHNVKPVFTTKMPKYEQLELAIPSLPGLLGLARRLRPDVIHLSTPGTVGMVGWLAAKRLRIPILGVYHTDFPAYIDHLFDDGAFTWLTTWFMRRFYAPFSAIFTRSEDYAGSLVRLGMSRDTLVRLLPGIETGRFQPSFRDPGIWESLEAEEREEQRGVSEEGVRVLYVGRVSVEKNMPLLERIWGEVSRRCAGQGLSASLIVVGDGPYKKHMQEELAGRGVHFLGFRHGEELSTIYASADLFVFPSTTDTLGQVVMESQSSGLPVLVTDEGGPKEVVEDGATGYVLDPEDTSAWVDRIVELVADEAARRAMGDAAHRAMQEFDIRNSFEHYWQVHERVWREHGAGGGRGAAAGGRDATGPALRESA